MTSRRILVGVLSIIVLGIAFWQSPLSIGLKVKYGVKHNNGLMLLEASNQLLSFRSNNQTALRQAVELKLNVAENEVIIASRIVDEMISKNPDDPSLLLVRARIHVMSGDFDQALIDLSTAKEITLHGSATTEFGPSPALIDEMIERTRSQIQ